MSDILARRRVGGPWVWGLFRLGRNRSTRCRRGDKRCHPSFHIFILKMASMTSMASVTSTVVKSMVSSVTVMMLIMSMMVYFVVLVVLHLIRKTVANARASRSVTEKGSTTTGRGLIRGSCRTRCCCHKSRRWREWFGFVIKMPKVLPSFWGRGRGVSCSGQDRTLWFLKKWYFVYIICHYLIFSYAVVQN